MNRVLGMDITPELDGQRKGDIRHSLADIEKARSLLGYKARYGFEKGLTETTKGYGGWTESSQP